MFEQPIGIIVPLQDPTPFSPFRPTEWREALVRAKESGFDGVELAITNPDLLEAAAVAEVLAAEDLRMLSITTGQAAGIEGLSLSSANADIRRRAVDRIKANMAFAEPFGAIVIIGSLRGADGDPDLLEDSLRALARSNRSVNLALEPLNRYESRLVNTIDDALRVIDRTGAENVGILFDTFHASIEEASIEDAIRQAGDRLLHVHLADSNRWVPGNGHTDFSAISDTLVEIDYEGSLVVESLPLPDEAELLRTPKGKGGAWSGSQ